MNKYKKLAIAAVSLVMAGTMALSLAACNNNPGPDNPNPGPNPGPSGGGETSQDMYGVLNEDGTINYEAYKRESPVTINLAICHNSSKTSTVYHDLGSAITMPDGKSYQDGDVKAAWRQMGEDLNITWNDLNSAQQTSKNLSWLRTNNIPGGGTYWDSTDIFTSDLSVVVSGVTDGVNILNLGKYLDYMPNLNKFIKEKSTVYLSLLQEGMNTTTGEGKTLYVAPYFDGNDDIERYCIIRYDWAEKLLNGNTATGGTVKANQGLVDGAQGASYDGTHVVPFFTENYTIESFNSDGSGKQNITKDYAAAKTAVTTEGNALNTAYKAITSTAYAGATGNIVEIMNAAIKDNPNATGAQLADLYRAYIDVAYKVGANAAYTGDNRAHLFTGYDAAWDVDDLVALLRLVKTNTNVLGAGDKTIYGIAPRTGQNDRTPDMVRLAAQLYGARGADSRLEYTYIDGNGDLQNALCDENFYQALVNFNTLKKEGLVSNYPASSSFKGERGVGTNAEFFMMYDYAQTQTINGFYQEDATIDNGTNPISDNEDFYFAPIMTPVSKWNDGADKIMRFTESWRATKTGGIAVNGAVENDANKLKAVLQFIDYLYSEDGQIVSTFGPMAEDATGTNGYWYNEKATAEEISAGKYFTYKGVKYSGTDYKGTTTPTITQALYNSFCDKTVNGWKVSNNQSVSNSKLNFTNYARQLMGATLPVGVKSQSFEYQLTSEQGRAGSKLVGDALAQGIIKGMTVEIKDGANPWYTVVPSGLPVDPVDQTTVLDKSEMTNYMYLTGTQKANKDFYSIFNWVIQAGLGTTYNQQDVRYEVPASVADLTTYMATLGQEREDVYAAAWDLAQEYWAYLKNN